MTDMKEVEQARNLLQEAREIKAQLGKEAQRLEQYSAQLRDTQKKLVRIIELMEQLGLDTPGVTE